MVVVQACGSQPRPTVLDTVLDSVQPPRTPQTKENPKAEAKDGFFSKETGSV